MVKYTACDYSSGCTCVATVVAEAASIQKYSDYSVHWERERERERESKCALS
jgi:hypothetical protein